MMGLLTAWLSTFKVTIECPIFRGLPYSFRRKADKTEHLIGHAGYNTSTLISKRAF